MRYVLDLYVVFKCIYIVVNVTRWLLNLIWIVSHIWRMLRKLTIWEDHAKLSPLRLTLMIDQLQQPENRDGDDEEEEGKEETGDEDVILGQVARIDAILNPVGWLFDREELGCYFLLKFWWNSAAVEQRVLTFVISGAARNILAARRSALTSIVWHVQLDRRSSRERPDILLYSRVWTSPESLIHWILVIAGHIYTLMLL